MHPETYVSSGLKFEYSYHDGDRDDEIIERKQLVSNELCNVFITKNMEYDVDPNNKKIYKLIKQSTYARINR